MSAFASTGPRQRHLGTLAHFPTPQRAEKSGKAAEHDVEQAEGTRSVHDERNQVGDEAAHREPRNRRRREQGQHAYRLRYAELHRAPSQALQQQQRHQRGGSIRCRDHARLRDARAAGRGRSGGGRRRRASRGFHGEELLMIMLLVSTRLRRPRAMGNGQTASAGPNDANAWRTADANPFRPTPQSSIPKDGTSRSHILQSLFRERSAAPRNPLLQLLPFPVLRRPQDLEKPIPRFLPFPRAERGGRARPTASGKAHVPPLRQAVRSCRRAGVTSPA